MSTLPIDVPSKVVCVGKNYAPRDGAGEPRPERPMLFAKLPSSLVGHGNPIVLPAITRHVDFEAELGVVLGAVVRGASPDEAVQAVAGYVCLNDVTARDLQQADGQWTRSKSLDTFCPVGPRLVPTAEVPDPHALRLRCLVNGAVVQDASTAEMIFGIGELIAFVSEAITLEPGDLLATGSPAGVPPPGRAERRLHGGDEVTVEIEGIGALKNPVVAEDAR